MATPKRPTPTGPRLTEDDLLSMSPADLMRHGDRAVGDRTEAAELVFNFIVGLDKGKPIPRRAYALIAWLLEPATRQKDPQRLPFAGKRGRRSGMPLDDFLDVLEVRRRAEVIGKDAALAEVAGETVTEDSLRGKYERNKQRADQWLHPRGK